MCSGANHNIQGVADQCGSSSKYWAMISARINGMDSSELDRVRIVIGVGMAVVTLSRRRWGRNEAEQSMILNGEPLAIFAIFIATYSKRPVSL